MATTPDLRQPRSCAELYRVFNRLALQGFGGVLPVAHRELVEKERWLSPEAFVELLTVSQVLPGPNVINLSIIFGDRHFGWRGSLAAVAGMLAVPMVIVLSLLLVYQQFSQIPWVAGALRGMGAVAAGLVMATGLKLARTLKTNPLGHAWGWPLALGTLALVGFARWPMVWVVFSLGGLGMAVAWHRLARQAGGQP